MGKIREKLVVDIGQIEQADKEIDTRVADVLSDVFKKCDALIAQAKSEIDELIGGYGASVVIKNDIQYNIVEKKLKTKKSK